MISEQDRESLINYRLSQAYETRELARFLIDPKPEQRGL